MPIAQLERVDMVGSFFFFFFCLFVCFKSINIGVVKSKIPAVAILPP